MRKKLLYSVGPMIVLLLFAVAFWVLHHELKEYHYQDIAKSLREIPGPRLLLAFSLTVLSYLVLTGYDMLALRYIQHPLAFGKIALASFIGHVFSYNVGLSILGGSAVRYRLYSAWGLSAVEITKIVAFCTLSFWLGVLTIGGAALLLEPPMILSSLSFPFASSRTLGVFLLMLVGGYLIWSAVRKTPLRIREWQLPFPSTSQSLCQIGLSTLDWALVGAVCYLLLPPSPSLLYPQFLGIYLLAQVIALISHVPGGIGVFETVILLFLSPTLPVSSVVGSLIAYRALYYLLPMGMATVLLAAHEVIHKREGVRRVAATLTQWVSEEAPRVLSLTTFVGGALLLFLGVTPEVTWRLVWLKLVLPPAVIEAAHFVASLVGTGLLLVSWGLQHRLDRAYLLTVGLLATGIMASLLKGLDYEQAIALAVILGALLPCRRYFYRKASIISQRFTPGWAAAIALVLLGSIWLGVFSHKHLKYAWRLWGWLALSGDVPRFLRGAAGAIGVALAFAMVRLLRPAPPEPAPPSTADLHRVRTIIATSRQTYANRALLGDKALLFSDNRRAFIMYGVEGRSWVALGDPVGPPEESADLVWQFRELCDRHGAWTVFYQVQPHNLALYSDLGLTLLQLGEEARVPLTTFSLDGSAHAWRRAVRRLEREGCVFEVISCTAVARLLPELQRVSDAWLVGKNAREQAFPLGFFEVEYLQHFPIGIVRQEGKLVAFANVWPGAEKEEMSVDLMRYLPEAPHGIMDYLFLQLMHWGRQEGYRWFNLGMAPLSGLEDRVLAPLWNRLGSLVFQHGEHFANGPGLRQYKSQFDPQWEPRYLASPGGLALPRILTNIASLISGGLKGVMAL
jgi:phosphatidylglycerol lysyltransferase